jgi:hypothetical protein
MPTIIDDIVKRRNNKTCKKAHQTTPFLSDYGVLYKTETDEDECFDLQDLSSVPSEYRVQDPVYCCSDSGEVDQASLGNKIKQFCDIPEKNAEALSACTSYLQDYLPKGDCAFLKDPRFDGLLDLLTKLVKFIYVVRYRCAGVANGCEVNQYDALLVLATSQIMLGFTDEDIRCVKYPNKADISPFPTMQNLGDFFSFSHEIMRIAKTTSGGLSAWIAQYKVENPAAESYASDFQPWARLLSLFVKSYTTADVPNITQTRLYMPFIRNELKSYTIFFETFIKDVFLDETNSENILRAQKQLITFLSTGVSPPRRTKSAPSVFSPSASLPSRSKTGSGRTRRRRPTHKSKTQKRRRGRV